MRTQTLKLVREQAHQLIARQYQVLNEEILPALDQEGIRFLRRTSWNDAQRAWVKEFFFNEVMPVLTPIGLDPSHPFPRVLNKSLNFAVDLQGKDAFGRNSAKAIVQAPRMLPRTIPLAAGNRRLRARLRVPVFHPARPCRRAVRRHGGAELPPVPRHAQQRPVRGRRRSEESAHQPAGRVAASPFRQCGATGGHRQLLAAGGRIPVAAIRTGAGRLVSRGRAGQSRAPDGYSRPGSVATT